MDKDKFISKSKDFSDVKAPKEQIEKANKLIEEYLKPKSNSTLVDINTARNIIKGT